MERVKIGRHWYFNRLGTECLAPSSSSWISGNSKCLFNSFGTKEWDYLLEKWSLVLLKETEIVIYHWFVKLKIVGIVQGNSSSHWSRVEVSSQVWPQKMKIRCPFANRWIPSQTRAQCEMGSVIWEKVLLTRAECVLGWVLWESIILSIQKSGRMQLTKKLTHFFVGEASEPVQPTKTSPPFPAWTVASCQKVENTPPQCLNPYYKSNFLQL
jgi:hypothetical protein